jgi:AmmeMemoRadiSam system protein B
MVALVAPHIDPWRGAVGYGHAYGALAAALPENADTFVLFGTSHAPMRAPFALCRKAFATPLGDVAADTECIDALAATADGFDPYGDQFNHKREHSLEFQVVFLKHLLGARPFRIVPVLAGLGAQQASGEDPAGDARVSRFLGGVRELVEARPGRVVVVAGADLAHVGPRFGDERPHDAEQRAALEGVDRGSLERAAALDGAAFWADVARDLDARRVCGLAPIWSLLQSVSGGARGRLLRLVPLGSLVGALFTLASLSCGGGATTSPTPEMEGAAPVDPATDAKLRASLAGAQRTEREKARDVYRHPLQTLEFFGLHDDMTVVEISPGGGWYTAVLAPVLRDRGRLFVVGGDPNGDPKSEGTQNAKELWARFQATPAVFDKVVPIVVKEDAPWVFGPPESSDLVLTFRNFHNWVGGPMMDKVLGAALAVLKHGGVLGLVDHRAKPGSAVDPKVVDATGYVPQDYVVETVEKAGFKLVGKAEINANPRDTKDYPKGVWTLPPTYELGGVDHAKYEAIGESDRMTLRFAKP